MNVDFKVLGYVLWNFLKFLLMITLVIGACTLGIILFDKWMLLTVPLALIGAGLKVEYDNEMRKRGKRY